MPVPIAFRRRVFMSPGRFRPRWRAKNNRGQIFAKLPPVLIKARPSGARRLYAFNIELVSPIRVMGRLVFWGGVVGLFGNRSYEEFATILQAANAAFGKGGPNG